MIYTEIGNPKNILIIKTIQTVEEMDGYIFGGIILELLQMLH